MSRIALSVGLAAWILTVAGAFAAPERRGETTPTPSEIARLERERDAKPRRAELRDALASAYYRYARAAFDRGEAAVYEEYLDRAMKEWIETLRLDPENPSPHTSMGIVAAYQGRIDDALESMFNARTLGPSIGVAYSNIAETLIYAGRDKREVETWLSRAERMGAPPAVVELNYCLLRWRDGDPAAAARRFTTAMRLDPAIVRVWNEAPVSKPIRSFVDLTDYCCGSPACGPYLARACQKSELEVARREVPEETVRRELVIEMERRRELERIYRQRKDLDIRVQKPEAEPAPAGETDAAKTEPKENAR